MDEMDPMQQSRPKTMLHDVSALHLKCSECGTPIDKLPFQPSQRQDGTYGNLYCYDCNKKRRPAFRRSF
ncbi:MAG: hypothetical protein KGI60_00985 [Patescibacteria group bacterium]|nr:hypothetical protein [Patescibacteria group bacterium]